MGSVVLDAHPLVAIVVREPSGPAVKVRLQEARESGEILICAVNLCEAAYIIERRAGAEAVARVLFLMERIGVRIVDADARLAGFAAAARRDHGLGIGDCFAAALAFSLSLPLMTGDADFLALEDHGLEIDWVGPPR